MRARLKAADCEVTDVVDHGFIRSIYFNDPNGIALEATYWVVDPTGWAEVSLDDERLFGDRNPVAAVDEIREHRPRRARPAHEARRRVHERHRGLGRQARLTRAVEPSCRAADARTRDVVVGRARRRAEQRHRDLLEPPAEVRVVRAPRTARYCRLICAIRASIQPIVRSIVTLRADPICGGRSGNT